MKNPLTKEAFAEWCEKQPDATYDYMAEPCAIEQYAATLGIKLNWDSTDARFWEGANRLAADTPHTFSELAQRLRA